MTMKKIFALTLGFAVLFSAISCSDKAFDEKFSDPSKTSTVTCDKLMTGAFYVGCDTYKGFGYNTYWRLYTWEGYFGRLAQITGFNNNSGGVYFLQDGWATDRWNNFYDVLAQFRLMQSVYDKESAEQQADDRIFLDLTEVFLYDQLGQMVDAFGPVPFKEAGFLGVTGDLSSSYPAYDSDEELYSMMITRLGELYNDIQSISGSATAIVLSKLKEQDFINGGDLDKWLRYTNSLRLRLAVHVAAKGSLTSTAKAAIADCASKKLVTTLDNGIFGVVDTKGVGDGAFWEWYREGFAGDGKNVTASQMMINAMQITGKDDPRLKVIYNPNGKGEFVGKSVYEDSADQEKNDAISEWKNRAYATLDSVTFITNSVMKNPVFTAAESYFLLAESFQQGYTSGDAKTAFVNGVKQSIIEWYDRNMTSVAYNTNPYKHYKATKAPTDTEMTNYANAVWDAYDNKLEAIMTQKWLHLGIMQAHEAFTDIRRTGFPKLDYPTDTQAQVTPNIIQRINYPLVEKSNNTANYNAATGSFKDDTSTVLFWATELK